MQDVDESPRRGVVVLGMHRSGTSATAGVLGLLGIEMVDEQHLMPPTAHNEKGYFESERLRACNDGLLHALGADWSAPPSIPVPVDDLRADDELVSAARDLLHDSLPPSSWGWKDPRLCLLLGFWEQLLARPPVLVCVHRHPLEVAASLTARDSLSTAAGLALWERYQRAVLVAASRLPTYVLAFDELTSDPAHVVGALESFLGHNGVATQPVDGDALEGFVDGALRHQTSDQSALAEHPLVSREQQELFARLEELRGVHEQGVNPQLGDETPWVEPLLAERRQVTALRRALEARDTTIHERNLELTEFSEEIERLRAAHAQVRDDRLRLELERDAAEVRLEAAARRVDLLLGERHGDIARAEALQRDLDAHVEAIAEIRASTSWRIARAMTAGPAALKRRLRRQ